MKKRKFFCRRRLQGAGVSSGRVHFLSRLGRVHSWVGGGRDKVSPPPLAPFSAYFSSWNACFFPPWVDFPRRIFLQFRIWCFALIAKFYKIVGVVVIWAEPELMSPPQLGLSWGSHQLCPQLTSALPVDQLQKKCEILRLFSWSWNREICRIFTVHQRDRRNSSVGIVELLYCFFMYPLASLIYMIYILYISKLRPKKCPRQAEGDKKLKISEQHPFLSHVFCCRCFMSLGAGWSKVKTLLNYARIEGVQKKRSW